MGKKYKTKGGRTSNGVKKFANSLLAVLVFLGMFNFALAEEKSAGEEPVEIQYFYGDNCANCKKAEPFLDQLEKKYPAVEIKAYEVFSDQQNAQMLSQFLRAAGLDASVVKTPTIFIAGEAVIGYLNDETTGKLIEEKVKAIIAGQAADDGGDEIINYPILGQINLSRLSLPVLTIVLAALDGFNPCAMWALLFLLALLINIRSKKRMFLIGGTFIAASGVVYFLIMSAWLNLFLAIGYVNLTRLAIGVLAIGAGIWQLRKFAIYRPGVCEIAPTGSKWHERLSRQARQTVESTTLLAALVGIVALAFGVNLIEFFCSAGLPAIYTKILSLSYPGGWGYYLYLLLYTFVFMLDDLIIFTVAVITLSLVGFNDKYAKWATLIGGLAILLLGLLLIFQPDFLLFG